MTYTITVSETVSDADAAAMRRPLVEFNESVLGPSQWRTLSVILRDERHDIVAGITGATYWGLLQLDTVAVREDIRGQGVGSRLLTIVENEGRGRGCITVYLDTLNVEALEFFGKRGYRTFCVLENMPAGRERYWLTKRLDHSPPASVDMSGVTLSDSGPSDDTAVVNRMQHDFDTRYGAGEDRMLFAILRDEGGTVVGGLKGSTDDESLFVANLAVHESVRDKGHGSRLLEAAEDEARRRGCVGAWLDTHSFQARPFYEKLGYEAFGVLDDCPVGYERIWLSKRLV